TAYTLHSSESFSRSRRKSPKFVRGSHGTPAYSTHRAGMDHLCVVRRARRGHRSRPGAAQPFARTVAGNGLECLLHRAVRIRRRAGWSVDLSGDPLTTIETRRIGPSSIRHLYTHLPRSLRTVYKSLVTKVHA